MSGKRHVFKQTCTRLQKLKKQKHQNAAGQRWRRFAASDEGTQRLRRSPTSQEDVDEDVSAQTSEHQHQLNQQAVKAQAVWTRRDCSYLHGSQYQNIPEQAVPFPSSPTGQRPQL